MGEEQIVIVMMMDLSRTGNERRCLRWEMGCPSSAVEGVLGTVWATGTESTMWARGRGAEPSGNRERGEDGPLGKQALREGRAGG